ncbi:hypothetical protein GF337_01525 [candidate division KSB1 bacterium]|nr:hypothetical protein [candidate division KSB1 bacterium]
MTSCMVVAPYFLVLCFARGYEWQSINSLSKYSEKSLSEALYQKPIAMSFRLEQSGMPESRKLHLIRRFRDKHGMTLK